MLRQALPALRDDYRALAAYRPSPGARVGVPLTVLVGRGDPKAGPEHAMDWQPHTDANFEFRAFPGGHFFPFQEPGNVALHQFLHTFTRRDFI